MDTIAFTIATVVYVCIAIPVTLWMCPRLFRYSSEDKGE